MWQHWHEQHASTDFLTVAADPANVPTGIFIDEEGVVRHLQAGDFSARDEDTRVRVERFLAGDLDVLAELSVEPGSRLESLEQELVDAKFRLASEFLARGQQ